MRNLFDISNKWICFVLFLLILFVLPIKVEAREVEGAHSIGDVETAAEKTESIGPTSLVDGKVVMNEKYIKDKDKAWNDIYAKVRTFIAGFTGIAALTFTLFFIYYFVKLGSVADNPQARSEILKGVLWTGIAAAGTGSVTLFLALAYNAFK